MGVVIKGRDSDLGRDLAVKVLLEQHREKPDLIRRFVEEAQISGQLQHPGVVPVYELGTLADHRPYVAMKLVKGRTLAALLAERAGPAEDRARLLGIFEQVCLTMAYAHVRGVVHRDLKPSNIMVGSFGEVQVMDWGLAKVLPKGGIADDEDAGRIRHETVIQTGRTGTDAELSQAGSVMGTLAVSDLVCAVSRCSIFSGCKSHPATGSLQPVAIEATHGGNELVEAFETDGSLLGDSASRQAVIASER